MKIAICGSMSFAKEMLQAESELKRIGHEPVVPLDTKECIKNPSLNRNVEFCIAQDIMRDHLQKIRNSDAILVLNFRKKNINGYIGSSTLVEMGFAHFFNKRIYLFNPIPRQRCAVEVKIMKPRILHGDLAGINDKTPVETQMPVATACAHLYQQLFLSLGEYGNLDLLSSKSKPVLRKTKPSNLVQNNHQISNYLGSDCPKDTREVKFRDKKHVPKKQSPKLQQKMLVGE